MSVDLTPYFNGDVTDADTAMSARSGSIQLYGGFTGTVAFKRKDPDGTAHTVKSSGAHDTSALVDGDYFRFDFGRARDIYLDASGATGTVKAEMIGERDY
ncbi:MAG: hypothetical protein P1U50_01055 [Parvibaculaceae bacterium]|nr:hypothetical protein [Parvibaculaceae bacterium]